MSFRSYLERQGASQRSSSSPEAPTAPPVVPVGELFSVDFPEEPTAPEAFVPMAALMERGR